MHAHSCTHMHAYTHAHTCMHTLMHTHACIHSCTHMHAYTHAHTCMHTLMHTHACIHSCTHMRAYTTCKWVYLEDLVVRHVGCQSCERLSTATSHAHEEGVAPWLLDDAADTTHMLYGKPAPHTHTHTHTHTHQRGESCPLTYHDRVGWFIMNVHVYNYALTTEQGCTYRASLVHHVPI